MWSGPKMLVPAGVREIDLSCALGLSDPGCGVGRPETSRISMGSEGIVINPTSVEVSLGMLAVEKAVWR